MNFDVFVSIYIGDDYTNLDNYIYYPLREIDFGYFCFKTNKKIYSCDGKELFIDGDNYSFVESGTQFEDDIYKNNIIRIGKFSIVPNYSLQHFKKSFFSKAIIQGKNTMIYNFVTHDYIVGWNGKYQIDYAKGTIKQNGLYIGDGVDPSTIPFYWSIVIIDKQQLFGGFHEINEYIDDSVNKSKNYNEVNNFIVSVRDFFYPNTKPIYEIPIFRKHEGALKIINSNFIVSDFDFSKRILKLLIKNKFNDKPEPTEEYLKKYINKCYVYRNGFGTMPKCEVIFDKKILDSYSIYHPDNYYITVINQIKTI